MTATVFLVDVVIVCVKQWQSIAPLDCHGVAPLDCHGVAPLYWHGVAPLECHGDPLEEVHRLLLVICNRSCPSSNLYIYSDRQHCFPGTQTNRWRSQDICCTETRNQCLFTSQLCLRKACWCQRSSRSFMQKKHLVTSMNAMLNDIIWRSIKRAQIPTHTEPTGNVSQGSKRPDGVTMIPWARGKPLAWDVIVSDTYVESHIISTSAEAGAAAKRAAAIKTTKFSDITSTHIFYPISIKTAGSWDVEAVELMEEIGRRTTVGSQTMSNRHSDGFIRQSET